MKICSFWGTNKLILTILCVIFLNFKSEACTDGVCCNQDLSDTIKSSTRKAMPNFLSFFSLSLGSAGFLNSMSEQSGNITGTVGASVSIAGALLNIFNWYEDRNSINGVAHNTLNGVSVLLNIVSGYLGFTALNCTDSEEKNIYAVSASILGASGLLLRGIESFLTQSPQDDYKCRMASTLARREGYSDVVMDAVKMEEGKNRIN